MYHLRKHLIGVEQGETSMFSEFEDGGSMWTGTGPRERRRSVVFSQAYRSPPIVHVSLSLWDMDTQAMIRADLRAEHVTEEGFDIVFNTWGDTRIARMRATWLSIGELYDEDEWQVD